MITKKVGQTKQSGQAMVEYVVILAVLTASILLIDADDGITRPPIDSLQDAVAGHQRGYTYALSLSAIPETDNYSDLATYYDSLGKYPELSKQIHSVADPLDKFVDGYVKITEPLRDLKILKPTPP